MIARHAGGTDVAYARPMNPKRQELAFLVRMWLPDEAEDDAQWRGWILEIASGRRFFVTQPGDVTDFIATHLAGSRVRKV